MPYLQISKDTADAIRRKAIGYFDDSSSYVCDNGLIAIWVDYDVLEAIAKKAGVWGDLDDAFNENPDQQARLEQAIRTMLGVGKN